MSVFGALVSFGIIAGMTVVTITFKSWDRTIPDQKALSDILQSKTIFQRIEESTNATDICRAPGCVHSALSILENMDPEVNPCDDFYRFACGNFLKKTTIPEDKASVDTYSIVSKKLKQQFQDIIKEEIRPNDIKPFRLVKTLYKACMNTSLIQEQELAPLHKVLEDLGGWPVLMGDSWIGAGLNWTEFMYRFRQMGYSFGHFIDFRIDVDLIDSTKRIISLDQASLGLSREYLTKGIDNEVVKAYHDYMVDVAETLGANREQAVNELGESLEFEMKLAAISLSKVERRYATLYNPMTVRELQDQFPTIPWLEYVNTLLKPVANITEDEIIVVRVPDYIANLEQLLEQTPIRVQANYAIWRAVASSVGYLNDEIREKERAYLTLSKSTKEQKPRWEECENIVFRALDISISSLYARKYFNQDAKTTAVEMVSNIMNEFKRVLDTIDWMDAETKKAALDKAESMSAHIAYPDELLNDNTLEEFYRKLELAPGNYLQNALNLTRFDTEYRFEKLKKPVNKSDWVNYGSLAIANAFYSLDENSIKFPAGMLQEVFFGHDRPKYLNYGAIGSVMGREITRGYDNKGRRFDKEGNPADWWTNEAEEKYLDRAECFMQQYGNYTDPESNKKLDGVNPLGESIADHGGVKVARLAYDEWARRGGPEPKLPGLNYSPKQMFWISAANAHCTVYRPDLLQLLVAIGATSPDEFRVIGPLSNMPEFAEDFNCPADSRMNRQEKCAVW